MADTGMIRWPMNFPPSSNTAILNEASVGRTTWTCRGISHYQIKMTTHSCCYATMSLGHISSIGLCYVIVIGVEMKLILILQNSHFCEGILNAIKNTVWPSWRQWPPLPRQGWWRCLETSWSWTLSSWCPPATRTCQSLRTCPLSYQTRTGLRWSRRKE